MNKIKKIKGKILVAASLILAITLLSACSAAGTTLGPVGDRITQGMISNSAITTSLTTICHATGDSEEPYEELTVNNAELNVHRGHPNDIIPMPADGCPASQVVTSDSMITICHATGSQNNPYNEIPVSVNGLNGHDGHEDDIIPAPEGGCPTTSAAFDNTTITTNNTIGNRFTTFFGSFGNRIFTFLGFSGNRNTATTTELTACHATGDLMNPYEIINVTYDISPVPVNGCPSNPVSISDGRITICHATGDQNNPYKEVTVNIIGLNGHDTHEGDVFPSPEGGCPTNSGLIENSTQPLTVCHATDNPAFPYEELTVNSAELNIHSEHPYDISPVPANGCPTNQLMAVDGMITICLSDDDPNDPYEEIVVSVDDLYGNDWYENDFFPAPEGGCQTLPWATSNDKITICHATGSQKNPYNEISVSVNGLNGHDGHEGDIIPAPDGGCPSSFLGKKPNKGKP